MEKPRREDISRSNKLVPEFTKRVFVVLIKADRRHVQADWANVRKTTNYQSNGPVTDVTSSAMTCYQLAPGNEGATTVNIQAGSTVKYNVKASVSHPGPITAWLAKVPAGQTAATYDGSGANWFKIYQEHPTVTPSGLTWSSQGESLVLSHMKNIPRSLRAHKRHSTDVLCSRTRRHEHQRPHPVLRRERRVPAACRAHRPSQRQQRRRRPAVHLVRAGLHLGRLRHGEPDQGFYPRRLQGHRPGSADQPLLPCSYQLHACWSSASHLLGWWIWGLDVVRARTLLMRLGAEGIFYVCGMDDGTIPRYFMLKATAVRS